MRRFPAHSRFHLLLHIAAAVLIWTWDLFCAALVVLVYAGVQ